MLCTPVLAMEVFGLCGYWPSVLRENKKHSCKVDRQVKTNTLFCAKIVLSCISQTCNLSAWSIEAAFTMLLHLNVREDIL